MKPIKLTMSAFGPYAGSQVLDFSNLGERNFFLIHGPTGSGKTTILDAICYALYGDTSGAQRDGKQMRSDHAEPLTITEVTYDFSIGRNIYRIKRCPEQERPKKRGEGTTIMRADATIWKRTGVMDDDEEGIVLDSGWNKVTATVENLLGFKSNQFLQVVMLPQGEFRKLLTADSKERQVILETLFRTEIYRHIEYQLKESAKQLKKSIEKSLEQKKWVLQEAQSQNFEELKNRLSKNQGELKAVKEMVMQGRAAVKKAQEELNAGQKTLERLEEKKNAQAMLVEIQSRVPAIENKRDELAKARQASNLNDTENALKNRLKELANAEKKFTEKNEQLEQSKVQKQITEQKLSKENEKEPERDAAIRAVNRLDELFDKVKALVKANEELQKVKRQSEVIGEKYTLFKKYLKTIQSTIEEKDRIYEKSIMQGTKVYAWEALCKDAQQIYIKRHNLEIQRQELNNIQQRYNAIKQKVNQVEVNYARAKEELAIMQDMWHRGQAVILAGTLKQGTPCPVCGSLEHPVPVSNNSTLPSEEEIKVKQQLINNIEKSRDKIKNQFNELTAQKTTIESKIVDLVSELGDNANIDIKLLKDKADEAQQQWYRAQEAAKTVENLTEDIKKLKEKENKVKEQFELIEKKFQEANTVLESARAIALERESAIPEGLRDIKALNNAQRAARNKCDRLKAAYELARKAAEDASQVLVKAEVAVQGARETLQEARKRVKEEEQLFAMRLKTAGFNNNEEYKKSKRTQEEMKTLEKTIKEFDDSLSAALDRRDRAVKAAEGLSEPDMDKLINTLAAAEQLRDRALQQEAGLRKQIDQENSWLQQLAKLNESLNDLEDEYSILGHLSEVSNGKNKYGITFQRFVLGALMDDVTLAATERLRLMSRGRYQLQRTLERSRSNAAGGLELEVFDTYTGVCRGVATLSGGETFLASLSLALGLADVVQTYSGGIHLDTIFVDEGFGTLDPESLDLAMRALIDLQKGGRLVGIISHVPELKELIDARLEIKPTKRGSTACFIVN